MCRPVVLPSFGAYATKVWEHERFERSATMRVGKPGPNQRRLNPHPIRQRKRTPPNGFCASGQNGRAGEATEHMVHMQYRFGRAIRWAGSRLCVRTAIKPGVDA